MVDVTNKTFEALLPQILREIKASSFLAIDTEFTGLLADSAFKNKLLDDGPQRYKKLCANLHRFSVLQLGLAVYTGVADTNAYSVVSYNFYLRPYSCVSCDPIIACQTSSLEFLQRFNFDFNKWIYEGVPYMNSNTIAELRAELLSLFSGKEAVSLPFELEGDIKAVGKWATSLSDGNVCTVSSPENIHFLALLLAALHNTFTGLWITLQDGQVVVRKVSDSERLRLETEDPERTQLVEMLIQRTMGFTSLFHHLVQLRKPIVLHNCLLDLMLIYKQFHRTLPSCYDAFKSDIHEMFPLIYDTKFVAEELKYRYRDDKNVSRIFNKTSLGDLVTELQGELPVTHLPKLQHLPPDNKYSRGGATLHEAGYDAFLTGLSFLRMAHLCAMMNLPLLQNHRPLSPQEHLYVLKQYANRVHMQRSTVGHMVLNGCDPRSKLPPWLVVEGQSRAVRVSPGLVSAALSKYRHLDVQPLNNSSVLIATSSWKSFTEILTNLSSESPFKARMYTRFRHSTLVRSVMWSSAMLSTGLCAWLVYKSFKKPSSP